MGPRNEIVCRYHPWNTGSTYTGGEPVYVLPVFQGAHTQAESLDELRQNLKEVLELCLEELGDDIDDIPQFVGIQQIEVAI